MIRLAGVRLRAGNRLVVAGVDLQLAAGEKVLLTGPSGAGKSTLLKAVVGGAVPESGEVWVDGLRLSTETVAVVRRRLAYLPQEPVLGDGTVEEALLVPFTFRAFRASRPGRRQLAAAMASVGLAADMLAQSCATLSGGEKQRLAVARALLLGHRVFLADEVTAALDAASREMVLGALLWPDHTVLAVAHDPAWRERVDRVLVLADGRLREAR